MPEPEIDYLLLTHAKSKDKACKQVNHFFNTTDLIAYDHFDIHQAGCMSATHPQFWPTVNQGLVQNNQFSATVLGELKATGISTMEDLLELSPGYPSKLLHILTHMIDGFISVDSALYNLMEDSHKISAKLQQTIQSHPEQYWLIPVITGTLSHSLLHPMPPTKK